MMCNMLHAQNVGINATGAAPLASAMLDVTSTTSGFLVPRMTLAQKTGIGAPATGLLVYQTNGTAGFWYYNGAVWVQLGGSDGDWTISGVNQYSAVSGNVGIGTVAPAYKLQVMGNAGFNDYLYHNGDANTFMLYTADLVRFYAGGLRMLDLSEAATDQVVINENSADINFRVESNGLTQAFLVDAGLDAVSVNKTPIAGDLFSVQGTAARPWVTNSYSTTTGGGALYAVSTNTGLGFNNFEGITYGTYSGVWGLADFNGNQFGAGFGVWGGTNDNTGGDANQWGLYTDDKCYALSYWIPSDERLKKDVKPVTNAIDDIMKLNAVSYYWDMENNSTFGFGTETKNYGFLAQDLNEVFPDLVSENSIAAPVAHPQRMRLSNENAHYEFSSVNYLSLIPINIQATKEQQILIEELQKVIEELEQRISELEK